MTERSKLRHIILVLTASVFDWGRQFNLTFETSRSQAKYMNGLSFLILGNPRIHISSLQEASGKGPEGEASLQNSLDMALGLLRYILLLV